MLLRLCWPNLAWKVRLIEESNLNWDERYNTIAKAWEYWMPASRA
ncbi:MAG TPA: hypothetical protein VHD14_14430 [Pseudolabrys sp.]|nr:hypothetical protein [Pseudolabrys sp.]